MKFKKLKNSELLRKSIDEFKRSEKIPLTIVIDNLRSLNNIGSIFRTADAFLIEEILICGISGHHLTEIFKKQQLDQLNQFLGDILNLH